MTEKMQMVCGTCGSADVGADASARWNAATQEWELSATYDKGSSCEVCEGECRIEEVPLDEYQAKLTETEVLDCDLVDTPVELSVEQQGDDEDKWIAIVSDEDVGELFRGTIIHSSPEDAKDAARRWAIYGKETGSY